MRSTLLFTLMFIFFTIIGTLTHEWGHYFAGESIGLNCKIHFASCECLSMADEKRLKFAADLQSKYKTKDAIPPLKWEEYKSLMKSSPQVNRLWVTIGGPLQTILTGLFGCGLLLIRPKKSSTEFGMFDWVSVFLSLFWLRQPFNLIVSVSKKWLLGSDSYFGGDELKISRGLNIWDGTVPILMGLIGLLIGIWVVFKVIPQSKRTNFILGGWLGGISGYILWMQLLGPLLIP